MDVREKEQRNAKYNEYVEQITPKNNLFAVCFKAFILGGSICLLGQIIVNIALNMGVDEEKAPVWCSLILVFISVVLTSLNLYAPLANWGGAGALVPITGFANSVVSPALEFKTEGMILGLGAKMFVIAGPVIVYGTLASIVYGIIYYILQLL